MVMHAQNLSAWFRRRSPRHMRGRGQSTSIFRSLVDAALASPAWHPADPRGAPVNFSMAKCAMQIFFLPPWSRGHPRTDDELASCSSSDTGLKVRLVAQSADRGVSNRSASWRHPPCGRVTPYRGVTEPPWRLPGRVTVVAAGASGTGNALSPPSNVWVTPHPDAPGMSWLRRETCAEGLGRDGGEANSWRVFPPPWYLWWHSALVSV